MYIRCLLPSADATVPHALGSHPRPLPAKAFRPSDASLASRMYLRHLPTFRHRKFLPSYHIPATPAFSSNCACPPRWALFSATALRYPSYSQWLPPARRGGHPFALNDKSFFANPLFPFCSLSFQHPVSILEFSKTCSLLGISKKVKSFAIKQIQPLFAKHPGGGYLPASSLQLPASRSATFSTHEPSTPGAQGHPPSPHLRSTRRRSREKIASRLQRKHRGLLPRRDPRTRENVPQTTSHVSRIPAAHAASRTLFRCPPGRIAAHQRRRRRPARFLRHLRGFGLQHSHLRAQVSHVPLLRRNLRRQSPRAALRSGNGISAARGSFPIAKEAARFIHRQSQQSHGNARRCSRHRKNSVRRHAHRRRDRRSLRRVFRSDPHSPNRQILQPVHRANVLQSRRPRRPAPRRGDRLRKIAVHAAPRHAAISRELRRVGWRAGRHTRPPENSSLCARH